MKSQEEVDALGLHLFADEQGREALREIDRTIGEIPGLEGLTLLENALDGALKRAARTPGWGGAVPAQPRDEALAGSGTEAWSEPAAA